MRNIFNNKKSFLNIFFAGMFIIVLASFIESASPEGGYVSLDGKSAVVVPDSNVFTGGSKFTWNIWAKQDQYVNGAALFGKYIPDSGKRSLLIRTVLTSSISVVLSNDGVNTNLQTSTSDLKCGIRNNNEWTMITITYDGSKVEYYRNGVKCDEDSASAGNIYNSDTNLSLGSGNNVDFKGSLDDVGIYNTVLTGSQIMQLYNHQEITGSGTPPAGKIATLVYHQIGTGSEDDEITPQQFSDEMKFLHDNSFRTITDKEFEQWQKGQIILPQNSVMIVFDDGRETVYTNAYPVMKNYNMKGNVAVVTRYASFTGSNSGYMTWTQLKNLVNEGWGMQSHSVDHAHMTSLSTSDFKTELTNSKSLIQSKLGVTIDSFVFPYYDDNAALTSICAQYYSLCWTETEEVYNPGYNYMDTDGQAYGKDDPTVGLKRDTIRPTTSLSSFKSMFDLSSGGGSSVNPVGEWNMDEGSGTIAHDSSGNGNNGVLTQGAVFH